MFPRTPLDITTELMIDGTWHDVSEDVYNRDTVSITRGRADEGSSADPGKATLTLNNAGGKFSPRNPRSPFYGKLGRNTPLRISVAGPETWLDFPGTTDANPASTPSDPVLDLAGDLDIRFEASLSNWQEHGTQELMGKYVNEAGRRSWLLLLLDGRPRLEWSGDGTEMHTTNSTERTPFRAFERGAIRVTLDVDNGSATATLPFYTGPSVDGPWEPLGQQFATAEIFPVAATDSNLRVGDAGEGLAYPQGKGRVHTIQVRDGIDGPAVANPDFSAQPVGTTSFTDAAGRAWTTSPITNQNIRFEGEVVSWPMSWDTTGTDAWTSITASGISRRLGQGSKALVSALRRRIESTNPAAYWPMEDEDGATQAFTPSPGVRPADTNNWEYGQSDVPAGSDPLPTWGESSYLNALVPSYPASPGWQAQWVYKMDQFPSALSPWVRLRSTGTVTRHVIDFTATGFRLRGYRTDPNEGLSGEDLVYQKEITAPSAVGQWDRLSFTCEETAPDTVRVTLIWTTVGGVTNTSWTTYTGTAGKVSRVYSDVTSAFKGMGFGHLAVAGFNLTNSFNEADIGYAGELADVRLARVASESAVPIVIDAPAGMPAMGPQTPATFMDTLNDCAAVDGGVLSESREGRGLYYRSRTTVYNQEPKLDLVYAEAAPPLMPVDDDQGLRNDVTVARRGGSKARHQVEDGPLSIQDPPFGVGRYDESVEVNAYSDDQLSDMAQWFAHLGSWDQSRYPVIRLNLAMTPHLIGDVCRTDLLDRLRISNPPEWLPPDPIDALIQGYTETLSLTSWDIEFNCSPHGPWNVGALGGYDVVENFQDDTYAFPVTMGGALPWTRTLLNNAKNDTWCLRSGAITANQTSDFTVDVPVEAETMSVWYKTDSEVGAPGFLGDHLSILADGVTVRTASGRTDWVWFTLNVLNVSQVTFRYSKDNSVNVGEDLACIDTLAFTFRTYEVDQARADSDGSVVGLMDDGASSTLYVTATDGPLWTDDPVEFPFSVNTGGEVMEVSAVEPYATDSFTRTLTESWGAMDTGQTWVPAGPSYPGEMAVDGEAGTVTLTTSPNSLRYQQILDDLGDCEVTATISVDQMPTGNTFLPGILLRANGSAYYWVALGMRPDGATALAAMNKVTQVGTGVFTGTAVKPGMPMCIRVRVVGHTVYAKAWNRERNEPTDWQMSRTMTENLSPSGAVGIVACTNPGNTNVNPKMSFDNFRIESPQRFTVTRGMNGLTLAHSAGADVRLATPTLVAW